MTFQEVLIECCLNDTFVRAFNRLSNTTLSFEDSRSPIKKLIDEATKYNNPFNNKPEEMERFISFCFEYIWIPLAGESCQNQE